MGQPIVVVDAFADRPFAGNPAAVCVMEGPADAVWMQHLAAEMNLSETAFLHPEGEGFRLRWFTPTVEVELCGHATLASAHVLWETGRLPRDVVARFQTRSGELTAVQDGLRIVMDFPSTPPTECAPPAGLAEALGTELRYVGRNRLDFVVEVESVALVRGLRPHLAALAALPVRGVIVTSASDDGGADFVSRFFAPGAGIDEDPVTGSAHCCLAPFWSDRLGRTDLVGRQVSARGGVVHVSVRGSRVLLGGTAVTVLRGELV